MRKSLMVCAIASVAMGGMIFRCNTENSPTTPPDTVPGNVILSEGFEGDLSNYKQITYVEGQGKMSISTQHALFGKGALTSDSNNTGIKGIFSPYIEDSIAGLQFYLMATKVAHTNFFAAICKPGSSNTGVVTKFGMGIDKSDSLNCIYDDYLNDIKEYKNFAPLSLNKWYKCKIEYNYNDTTLTYYLDNAVVHTIPVSNPTTLQIFIAMRDSLGAQGQSGYYLDNVSIYKR